MTHLSSYVAGWLLYRREAPIVYSVVPSIRCQSLAISSVSMDAVIGTFFFWEGRNGWKMRRGNGYDYC